MSLISTFNGLRCSIPSHQSSQFHFHGGRPLSRLPFFPIGHGNHSATAASPVSGRTIICTATRTSDHGYSTQELSANLPQRGAAPASVLAIGTANPAYCLPQSEYADWYFRVTKRDHLTKLNAKMKRICNNSGIKKRHFVLDEDTLRANPDFVDRTRPSLDARHDVAASAMPELAAAAARNAIAEWGRPAADITHLIFTTYAGVQMPGADLRLASLLGLAPSVQRTMLYFQGCAAGSTALRLAKDVAENNPGARVLVACAEVSVIYFHEPDERHVDTLVVQALFGDGAGAAIVGSSSSSSSDNGEIGFGSEERPLFEMVSAVQTTVPETEYAVSSRLSKCGGVYHLSKDMPSLVAGSIERCLLDVCSKPLNLLMSDNDWSWNSLFWAVHPGGRAILDGFQQALKLNPSKLAASRHVLSEYGNLSGASTLFVLDEVRRRRGRAARDRKNEAEEECEELGAMVALGPGLVVETMLLRAVGA